MASVSWSSARDDFAFDADKVDVTISSESSISAINKSSPSPDTSFLSGGGLFKSAAKPTPPPPTPPPPHTSAPTSPPTLNPTGREITASGIDRPIGRNAMTSQRRGTFFGTYTAEGPKLKLKTGNRKVEERPIKVHQPVVQVTAAIDEEQHHLEPSSSSSSSSSTSPPPHQPPHPISQNLSKLQSTALPSLSTKAGLFCFELYVHAVHVDSQQQHRSGIKRPPSRPTVAFRFLDFPTQNIEPPRATTSTPKSKNQKWSVNIDFGKSCLLESTPAEVHARCLSTPLYIVLLDARTNAGKLLGATVIDLADYVYTASTPGVTALPPEAHYGAEGFIRSTYSLLGLTSVKVGSVDVSLRLRNLGSHMLSHWRSTHPTHHSAGHGTSTELPRFVNTKKKEKKQHQHQHQRQQSSPLPSPAPSPGPAPAPVPVPAAAAPATVSLDTLPPSTETTRRTTRDMERERALEATIKAIAIKTHGRPGHSAVPADLTTDVDNNPMAFSPPPLFYHNAGAPPSNAAHASPVPVAPGSPVSSNTNDPDRSNATSTTDDRPFASGAPSPGTAVHRNAVTSQRRGTYFGTFTTDEARERKVQGGDIVAKDRNSSNGLSISDRRRREMQLRAIWMGEASMVEAWAPPLHVRDVDDMLTEDGGEKNEQQADHRQTTTRSKSGTIADKMGDAMDLLDMKDSLNESETKQMLNKWGGKNV